MGCCGGNKGASVMRAGEKQTGRRNNHVATNSQKTAARLAASAIKPPVEIETALIAPLGNLTPAPRYGSVTGRQYMIGGVGKYRIAVIARADLDGFLAQRKFGKPIYYEVEPPKERSCETCLNLLRCAFAGGCEHGTILVEKEAAAAAEKAIESKFADLAAVLDGQSTKVAPPAETAQTGDNAADLAATDIEPPSAQETPAPSVTGVTEAKKRGRKPAQKG